MSTREGRSPAANAQPMTPTTASSLAASGAAASAALELHQASNAVQQTEPSESGAGGDPDSPRKLAATDAAAADDDDEKPVSLRRVVELIRAEQLWFTHSMDRQVRWLENALTTRVNHTLESVQGHMQAMEARFDKRLRSGVHEQERVLVQVRNAFDECQAALLIATTKQQETVDRMDSFLHTQFDTYSKSVGDGGEDGGGSDALERAVKSQTATTEDTVASRSTVNSSPSALSEERVELTRIIEEERDARIRDQESFRGRLAGAVARLDSMEVELTDRSVDAQKQIKAISDSIDVRMAEHWDACFTALRGELNASLQDSANSLSKDAGDGDDDKENLATLAASTQACREDIDELKQGLASQSEAIREALAAFREEQLQQQRSQRQPSEGSEMGVATGFVEGDAVSSRLDSAAMDTKLSRERVGLASRGELPAQLRADFTTRLEAMDFELRAELSARVGAAVTACREELDNRVQTLDTDLRCELASRVGGIESSLEAAVVALDFTKAIPPRLLELEKEIQVFRPPNAAAGSPQSVCVASDEGGGDLASMPLARLQALERGFATIEAQNSAQASFPARLERVESHSELLLCAVESIWRMLPGTGPNKVTSPPATPASKNRPALRALDTRSVAQTNSSSVTSVGPSLASAITQGRGPSASPHTSATPGSQVRVQMSPPPAANARVHRGNNPHVPNWYAQDSRTTPAVAESDQQVGVARAPLAAPPPQTSSSSASSYASPMARVRPARHSGPGALNTSTLAPAPATPPQPQASATPPPPQAPQIQPPPIAAQMPATPPQLQVDDGQPGAATPIALTPTQEHVVPNIQRCTSAPSERSSDERVLTQEQQSGGAATNQAVGETSGVMHEAFSMALHDLVEENQALDKETSMIADRLYATPDPRSAAVSALSSLPLGSHEDLPSCDQSGGLTPTPRSSQPTPVASALSFSTSIVGHISSLAPERPTALGTPLSVATAPLSMAGKSPQCVSTARQAQTSRTPLRQPPTPTATAQCAQRAATVAAAAAAAAAGCANSALYGLATTGSGKVTSGQDSRGMAATAQSLMRARASFTREVVMATPGQSASASAVGVAAAASNHAPTAQDHARPMSTAENRADSIRQPVGSGTLGPGLNSSSSAQTGPIIFASGRTMRAFGSPTRGHVSPRLLHRDLATPSVPSTASVTAPTLASTTGGRGMPSPIAGSHAAHSTGTMVASAAAMSASKPWSRRSLSPRSNSSAPPLAARVGYLPIPGGQVTASLGPQP